MPPKEHIRFVPPPPAQCLTELKNLVHRSRTDYKGHLGPKLVIKKATDYEADQQAKIKMMPDGERFRDFHNPKHPLAAVATKSTKVTERPGSARPASASTQRAREEVYDPNHPNHNVYKQQLDSTTGRPVLETVLHWDEKREAEAPQSGRLLHDGKRTGRRSFAEKYESNLQREEESPTHQVHHATRQDVEDLTPRHRTALIRALTLAHPKFTQDSVVHHSTTEWNQMSQLLSHAYVEPSHAAPKKTVSKRRPESARVRNNVRMVALMRQAQGKSQRAWH